ncbi:bifunctional DNA primase/polymerase [Streptomyces sp. RKAG337]|uniref:bifunctional DNA primase/polymerase n=1 Tax=Streptomyces sp. RKAG337 TaxID=2893404 RepID=UPI00203434BD|nr:bifunctional DNA primase/polymerase [Streptomyces sp. RKAG337]MCM2428769.1 bifunctional DNA primase/polymerase [Streptomyces sp. RKAG337]
MAGKSRLSEWLRRRSAGSDTDPGSAPALAREELINAAAAAGFPVAPAAHPSGYGCSCDRVGCPTPGMHPVSFAWHTQATTDPQKIDHWLHTQPLANFISATGASHDVLDVPADAGRIALDRLAAEDGDAGPVAAYGDDRLLFFTATRGTPVDEDEWWPCELDCHPETVDEHPGLRWHCRGSYVLLPPAKLPTGGAVTWLPDRGPDRPLPDPLPLLEILMDSCAQVEYVPETVGWRL